MRRRLYPTAAVVGMAACLAAAAQAQTAADSAAPAAEAARPGELAEVVVTAQKRSERLQDVPITVEAVSADAMKAAGVNNITDLATVVPGLQVGDADGFATPHLRGVGSTIQAPGIESPVAIYVDGVYYAATTANLFDFIDVNNVEVLKGPQGTLFGRNATGGLIQVFTKTPSHTTEIDADIGYGNYQTGRGDLYVTGGLSDTLAASVALQVSGAGEGYGHNLVTGNDSYQNYATATGRTKLLWTPTDNTSWTLAADFSKSRNSDLSARIPPGASNIPGAFNPAYQSPWDSAGNIDGVDLTQTGGLSLRLDQDEGFARLMNLVAYRKNDTTIDFSLEQGAPPSPFFDGMLSVVDQQFSEELQLSSEKSAPIIWSAGLYYFHSQSQYDPNHANIDGTNIFSPAEQLANSAAAYGQMTIPLVADTNLTLGGRYTWEKHTLVGDTTIFGPGSAQPLSDTFYPEREVDFDKPTYRVALDHHITPDTMIYASFNTGFKSGGFNTGSIGDSSFAPETLKAYEVGIKSDLFGRRLRTDLAGFHYDYDDIQVQKVEGTTTGVTNGGAATVDGVDLDLTLVAATGLTFGFSGEYVNAYFTAFDGAPLSNPILAYTTNVLEGSAAGKQIPYAPHVSFSVTADYVTTVAGSEMDYNITAQHSSNFFLEPDNVLEQGDYTRLNASIRWHSPSQQYAVLLWGRNLTNEAVFSYGGTLTSGLHTVTYEPPRTYGVTLEYHLK